MADLGMNLVGVIHQPRYAIFTLFDDVMLLGRGGRLVYLGPSHLALCYFESLSFALPANENPSDFLMDVISGRWVGHGRAGPGSSAGLLSSGAEQRGAAGSCVRACPFCRPLV